MIQVLMSVRHFTTTIAMKKAVSEFRMSVPWGEMRGQIWGPDHGRPVLCLHGWADNSGTFNTLVPQLPDEWRCVAVDIPGHGLSSHRPPGVFYNFPEYVADLCRVIEVLEWKRFSIIGHSMGGNIASLLSALYPEMVESVVLLDSYGFFPIDMTKLGAEMRKGFEKRIQFEKEDKTDRTYSCEKATQRLIAANPSLSEQSANILLERGSVQVEGGVVFTRDFRINLTNIWRLTLEQCLDFQSKIKARVLMVIAEDGLEKSIRDPEFLKMIETLVNGFKDKGATIVTVPGNHHVHLNSPEVVAPLVVDFLQTDAPHLSDSTEQASNPAKL